MKGENLTLDYRQVPVKQWSTPVLPQGSADLTSISFPQRNGPAYSAPLPQHAGTEFGPGLNHSTGRKCSKIQRKSVPGDQLPWPTSTGSCQHFTGSTPIIRM